MDRRQRMDRTLICLVVSMTLGAVVLQWIQPDRGHSRAHARDLIAGMSHPWRGIHLDPARASFEESIRHSHFVITADGHCRTTPNWTGQETIGADAVIRIALITPPYSHEVTREQSRAAQLLIEALIKQGSISPEQVIWDDTLTVPPASPVSSTFRPLSGSSGTAR